MNAKPAVTTAAHSPTATTARVCGAFLLFPLYLFAYLPFSSVITSVWHGYSLSRLFLALGLMAAMLFACYRMRPRTVAGRLLFWACVGSAGASLIGTLLLAMPQDGHPSIGIFFLLVPLRLHTFVIPVLLALIVISLVLGEKIRIVGVGFVYALLVSFCFSNLRDEIPPYLDAMFGTQYFSRTTRRMESRPPDYDEMVSDIALIRKGPLTYSKLYHLEIAVEKAPHYRCDVLEYMIDEFARIPDFELQRRVLFSIGSGFDPLRAGTDCMTDPVLFFSRVMQERNADLSDIAACLLVSRFFEPVLVEDRYHSVRSSLGDYLLYRQLNPQPHKLPNGKWYSSRTVNCVAELKVATTNFLQRTEFTNADRKAITNLTLFLPYLRARQADDIESQQPHKEFCADLIAKIIELQAR